MVNKARDLSQSIFSMNSSLRSCGRIVCSYPYNLVTDSLNRLTEEGTK